ncbi:MAG: hypothetical protein U0736_20405 [Gemmataceae bacterium]
MAAPVVAGPAVATEVGGGTRLGSNVSVLGRSSLGSGWGYGFDNPPPPPASAPRATVAPANPGTGGSNPYTLSTAPSTNPYMGGTGSLGSNLAGGAALGGVPFGGLGGFPWWGIGGFGLGAAGPGIGYGAALEGMASLQRSQGQYWKDITQAQMQREEFLQKNLETARRRVEFEAWYESMRPTATKMLDRQMATDLDTARRFATDVDIASGRALNTLLRNIQASGRLNQGANVPLDEDVLKNVNLTGGTSTSGVGMLKDGGKLPWPGALQDPMFDESRKRLTRNLQLAVATLKDKEPVPEAVMKDIRGDFKSLNDKLAEAANDLDPAQYVEARRFLNQLSGSIKSLSDPRVANYFNNTWSAKGRSVAELVAQMTKEGLLFAPAGPNDDAAYRAVYQALRAFDNSLQYAQRTP